jgi:hypothetical protein
VTHDERQGLQNLTETPTPDSDANDNDISFWNKIFPADVNNRLNTLANRASPIGAALSGHIGEAGNTGSPVIIINGSTYTNLAFTDSDGLSLDGDDSVLTMLDLTPIYLHIDSTNDNIALGRKGMCSTAESKWVPDPLVPPCLPRISMSGRSCGQDLDVSVLGYQAFSQ